MSARPGAAVAVVERVDGLELGVGDGGLDQRWEMVAVAELAQVGEELRHVLGRRRDEVGAAGVVVVAADPVLHVADSVRRSRRSGLVA